MPNGEPDSNIEDCDNDDNKASVPMDTKGNESPSYVEDGNFESEEPDDAASTIHYVGVLCKYNDNDVYIPSSAEVFNSIDHNRSTL